MIDKGCTVYSMNASLFTERGVHHLATHDGKPSGLVAFHFHDSLLVARDFEVDVPDWEHRDEWVP